MYVVAEIDEYHRPSKIFGRTRSKKLAFLKAKEFAKKYKTNVGVFEYTKYKYYGMIKGFDMFD